MSANETDSPPAETLPFSTVASSGFAPSMAAPASRRIVRPAAPACDLPDTSWPFYNTGTVDVQSGQLRFYAGYTQTTGETRLSGGSISTSAPDAAAEDKTRSHV